MADSKNQHYVPQHYLKRFCHPGTRLTSLIHIPSERFVPVAPIKDQCSADYFYGNDGTIESVLCELEAKIDPLFESVIAVGKAPFDPEARHDLLGALSVMYSRTQKRVEELSLGTQSILTEMFDRMARAGKFPEPPPGLSFEQVQIKLNNEAVMPLFHAIMAIPLMLDLELKMLRPADGKRFISGDHPVVMTNQMFYGRTAMGTVGLANKGFQMFLPLSPTHCIVAYDSHCYRIGRPEKRVMQLLSGDVDLINALQVLNAESHLYFADPSMQAEVSALLKRYGGKRSEDQTRVDRVPVPASGAGTGTAIIMRNMGVPIPGKWSFCRNRIELPAEAFGQRDPALCAAFSAWAKESFKSNSTIPFSDWLARRP